MGCQILQRPLTYLGTPLEGNPCALSFWDPVVCKILKQLDCLKDSFFSLGGWITLIQSCLASILLYFLSLFHIPVIVAKKIEKVIRDFLGTFVENQRRGLGLGDLVSKNKALIANWLLQFPSQSSSL